MKNIFVGTLFNGEAEFQQHSEIINRQKNVVVKHHVIKNLDEYGAHKKLWSDWADAKEKFDVFVKIDADTVLKDEYSLSNIGLLFDDPKVTGAQIKIHDYFSNSLISGLNCFSPEVLFKKKVSRLTPDKVDYNHKIVLKGFSTEHLEPIAFHCLTPNIKQSFFYGYHRTLKNQKPLMQLVARIWQNEKDLAREWALRGAFLASKSKYRKIHFKSLLTNKQMENAENIDMSTLSKYANEITTGVQ